MKKVILYYMAIVFIILMATACQDLGKAYKIPNESMKPTLVTGDRLFVNLDYYLTNEPKRGDVIVFKFPKDKKKDYIKRIIGLPNEEIRINEGQVFINNTILEEDYVLFEGDSLEKNMDNLRIPSEDIFVMGDNRNHSYDSRMFGTVPIKDIKGKATKIYWAKDKSKIWSEIK
jgi:signal peptidase I